MKKTFLKIIFLFLSASISFGQVNRNTPLIIDHTAAALFDSIPDSIIVKSANIRVMFRHASVGTTISNGLDCIQGTRTNPAICKTFPEYKYDRRDWVFQGRGNSGWYGKINDFVEQTALQIDSFDLFSYKYCYLEGLDELAEPCGKPLKDASVAKAWNTLRDSMESLEKQYPDKFFVWWTIPLTQPGQRCTDTLNYLMRKYVTENNKILFDIADIQCHDSFLNRMLSTNGLEMAYYAYCGEKPPGPSCHPNWTGSVILAKAFWYMMACLTGDISIPAKDSLPELTTRAVSSITHNSSVSGGDIEHDGGNPIIAKGVVWGTSPQPEIYLPTKTNEGSGSASFISTLNGLEQNTTYYLRAYAINDKGTAYGNEHSFNTDISIVTEHELRNILIYPNPSRDRFYMNIPLSTRRIQVINPNGEVIHDADLIMQSYYEFNVSEKGVFLIRLHTNHQVISKKLVVIE